MYRQIIKEIKQGLESCEIYIRRKVMADTVEQTVTIYENSKKKFVKIDVLPKGINTVVSFKYGTATIEIKHMEVEDE